MIRSSRVHSIFAHRYVGSFPFEPTRHFRPSPRISPVISQRPRVTGILPTEDEVRRIFHESMSDARRSAGVFRFVGDHYLVVESFLQKAFKKHQSLSASDIADALGIDYGEVREILARMIKERKLGVK